MRFSRYFLAFTAFALLLPVFGLEAQTTSTTDTTTTTITVPVDNESAGTNNEHSVIIGQDGVYERAIVRSVSLGTETIPTGGTQRQHYNVEILSGSLKGQTRTLSSDLESNPYNLNPSVGDRVVILIQGEAQSGSELIFLEGFDRRGAIFWLVVLFFATLVLLAGWQGMKVALSISISILLIGWVLIPAFLNGLNPIPVAIVLAAVLVGISTVSSTGWNKKTLVTVIGTVGGVLVAYAISHLFATWAHLEGLSNEEDRLFFAKNPLLDPRGLMFAGIIIAAMGVVEDVAVSISSGVFEVHRNNSRLSLKELFRSGMVIGRDHMSALANTLIFAYVGASLSTLLLYTQYGGSWLKFLNFDSVVDEVVRSLSGTIGLIFTVPITAILAAFVASRMTKPDRSSSERS
ncbi:MAG: YibE/F family protein [Patescibacteria group bacterium]|jgi:uncharacterized membrane protein